MTTFLLFLSLLLNIAAIFSIILLYLRQNRLVEAEKKQERIIKEIEEVFTTYLLELKEENENFLNKVEKVNGFQQNHTNQGDPVHIEDAMSAGEQENSPPVIKGNKGIYFHAAKKAYSQTKSSVPAEQEDNLGQSENPTKAMLQRETEELDNQELLEEVIAMKNNGRTNEEIAKILNKGKTEIELLLKFSQNP